MQVEFEEDKILKNNLSRMSQDTHSRDVESWAYRYLPGNKNTKRLILIVLIILMFALSVVFLLVNKSGNIERQSFEQRI